MRIFLRGLLWISLIYLLFDNFTDHYSRTLLLLLATILMLRIIKKKKKDGSLDIEDTSMRSDPVDVYKLRDPLVGGISTRDKEQIAIAIATSAALGNMYQVEDQIELRVTTNYPISRQDKNYQFFGRVSARKLDVSSSSFPFEVFLDICENRDSRIDSEFLEIIKYFGWIGLEMGNRPPLSLTKIEEACSNSGERKVFAAKIASYVIEPSSSSELMELWNSQCNWLSKLIQSDEGMNAIRVSEPYWLPYFN